MREFVQRLQSKWSVSMRQSCRGEGKKQKRERPYPQCGPRLAALDKPSDSLHAFEQLHRPSQRFHTLVHALPDRALLHRPAFLLEQRPADLAHLRVKLGDPVSQVDRPLTNAQQRRHARGKVEVVVGAQRLDVVLLVGDELGERAKKDGCRLGLVQLLEQRVERLKVLDRRGDRSVRARRGGCRVCERDLE